MKPDQARLLRMAAVLLPVACSSAVIPAAEDGRKTGGINQTIPVLGKDFAVSGI